MNNIEDVARAMVAVKNLPKDEQVKAIAAIKNLPWDEWVTR
jgi:hypothetical protein